MQLNRRKDTIKQKSGLIIEKWLPWLLLLILTGTIFYVNDIVGLFEDDLWYATNLVTGQRLQSFADVVESQIWHYWNWGGRSIAHGMLQISILAGGRAIDILNTAAVLLLACIIGGYTNEKSGWKYIFVMGVVISLNPTVERTVLWQSGVANYLYMSIFLLLFLLMYLRELRENSKPIFGAAIWMIPVGLFAGWSNENMGPSVLIGALAVMFLHYRKHHKMKLFMVTGSLSCLAGSVLLIAAPGNFIRAKQAIDAYDTRIYRQILNRIFWVSRAVFDYMFPILLILVFLIFIYVFVLRKKLETADGILLVAAALSVGAMILSPHYPDRATFGTLTLIAAESVRVLAAILRERKDLRFPVIGIISVFWLASMYDLANWVIVHLNLSW